MCVVLAENLFIPEKQHAVDAAAENATENDSKRTRIVFYLGTCARSETSSGLVLMVNSLC